MKKILGLFTILFMMIVTLASCGSKVPSEVVGKYNLTEISGIPGISVSTYEYNYVELKSNGKYYLENKVYGTVTSQEGTFEINDEMTELTLITKNGSTSVKETASYDKETYTFVLEEGIEGYTISMTFVKEVVEETE